MKPGGGQRRGRPGPRTRTAAPRRRGAPPERNPLGRGVRIVHEDADLLVVDKGPGLLTSALQGQEGEDSVFGRVKRYARLRGGRHAHAWIIHRLDKEASGLLVFAKSEAAYHWLKEDFRARRVHRLYVAVVEGVIAQDTGTIRTFLDEAGGRRVRSVGAHEFTGVAGRPGQAPRGPRAGEGGPRLAVTHFRVLHRGPGRTLVQLRLETGRRNQIRVHMADIGHPVAGDQVYGGTTDPIGRLALHATDLGLTHPGTGRTERWHSRAPRAFYECVGTRPPRASDTDPDNEMPAAEQPAAAIPPPGPGDRSARAARSDGATPGVPARAQAPDAPMRTPGEATSWEHVAEWYGRYVESERGDHFSDTILPGVVRLIQPREGMRVLDVACGSGALVARLVELGAAAHGIDAAPSLIEHARARTAGAAWRDRARFDVLDAQRLAAEDVRGALRLADLDAVACVMALMNIDPIEPVILGSSAALRPGGAFVGVILHPSFRAPEQTAWGWETEGRGDRARFVRQYRRVDGYLTPRASRIVMNPGAASRGEAEVVTWTFHRPLQSYVRALAQAGLRLDALEEWPSQRRSEPGPRAVEENRARREIPMFLAFRAIRA